MIDKILMLFLTALSFVGCFAQKVDKPSLDCDHFYDKNSQKLIYVGFTSEPISPDSISGGYLNYIFRNINLKVEDLIEYSSIRPRFYLLMDEKGKIIDCIPLKSSMINKETSDYTVLDKEIVRIFRQSANWTPAKCGDRNILIRIMIEVRMPRLSYANNRID